MTSEEIVYHQGIRMLAHAVETGNVTETCRVFGVSPKTFQNLLVGHGLGRRHQRVARTAAIAAATSGHVTKAATDDTLFGFCHWAGAPGQLVSIDSF